MNEIISVIINEETREQLVNARDLHKVLEVQKRFSAWIETYIKVENEYGFEENIDFTSVLSGTVVNNGAEIKLQDYALNIDMAKEIALLSRSKKGKEIRKYFIACEKELKEMHFKAIEIFGRNSKNRTFRDFASLIGIKGLGGTNLGKWAREEGLVRDWYGNPYEPYRQYIELGYFEVKERYNDKVKKNIRTTYITPKGAVWLHKKLVQAGYSPKSICEIVLDNKIESEKIVFGTGLINKVI